MVENTLQDTLHVQCCSTHAGPCETHGDTGRELVVQAIGCEYGGSNIVLQGIFANIECHFLRNLETPARSFGGGLLRFNWCLSRVGGFMLLVLCLGSFTIVSEGLLFRKSLLAQILNNLECSFAVNLLDLFLQVANTALSAV